METKYFPSKISMLQALDKLVDGLDVNKSAFLPHFGFVTKDGETLLSPSALSFVDNFNKTFGEILSLKGTQVAGGGGQCIVSFLPKEDVVVLEDEIVEVSTEEKKEFNLEYALSLQEGVTKKEAKEALEGYGRKFDVELSRSKTFENMLKDLQKQLQ